MSEITITVKTSVEVKYLKAICGVRYWEDGTVDGIVDDDEEPAMPFATDKFWEPVIEIETGTVVGWPTGTTADIHYKVCDDGAYTLLDAEWNEVKRIDGYVPSIMCPEGEGYGDYVIMKIDGEGRISNWTVNLSEFEGDDE